MIRAGIFGATGYTGLELMGILAGHPEVEIRAATSESRAGESLREVHPGAPDVWLVPGSEGAAAELDVAFLCLPHGASATTAAGLLEKGVRVIDLSADFRLRDPESYAHWYGGEHPAPEWLPRAVYGLTEHSRDVLREARLVANPGCYATSILLALQPLVEAGAVGGPVIADSKSGVSGAGRAPKPHTHFVEVHEGFSPYGIGRQHRHLPEMEQALGGWHAAAPNLIFSPHLLPVSRGILSTIYVPLADGWSATRARERLVRRYASEPFLRTLAAEKLATLAQSVRSNRCVLGTSGVTIPSGGEMLIVTSTLDNLVKGAAGQAVQNLNVLYGLEETIGLVI